MKNFTEKEVKSVLNFDPLNTASELTGVSYKESEFTESLGFALAVRSNKIKKNMLQDMGDTHRNMKFEDYVKIIENFGFEKVYEEQINKGEYSKIFRIYFEKERGILLKIDSYYDSINSADFFFQHLATNTTCRGNVYSSGGFKHKDRSLVYFKENGDKFSEGQPIEPRWKLEDDWEDFKIVQNKWREENSTWKKENNVFTLWTGHNHGVEAIVFQIKQLDKSGIFVKRWTENNDNISTVNIYCHDHYSDKEWDDKNSVGKKRMNALPEHVKKCIRTL